MGKAWGAGLILWQVCPNCDKRGMYYNDKIPAYGVNKFYCKYCKNWDFGRNLIQQRLR